MFWAKDENSRFHVAGIAPVDSDMLVFRGSRETGGKLSEQGLEVQLVVCAGVYPCIGIGEKSSKYCMQDVVQTTRAGGFSEDWEE